MEVVSSEELFRDAAPFIIEKLEKDRSYLVRVSAAEALCHFDREDVRLALIKCIQQEENYLVREYAVSSLGIISNSDDLKFLIGLADSEKNPEILIHIYTGILIASRNIFAGKILEMISNSEPIIKSSAINALAFCLLRDDFSDIIAVLTDETEKIHKNLKSELKKVCDKFIKLQKIYDENIENTNMV